MSMKNLKKKRILLILVLFIGISASFAFYQTQHTFENEFITLEYGAKAEEEFESPNNWKPGDTVPKTVAVKNTGDICENIRVSYTEEWKSKTDTVLPNIDPETNESVAILNLDNQNDWIQKEGYYYYNKNVLPNENTTSFLESVTFNPNYSGNVTCENNANKVTCTGGEDSHIGGTYTLSLNIESIQCNGIEDEWNVTLEELQNKYNITYHLNGGSLKNNALNGYPENNEEIILPIPEKRGYDFTGWYEDNTLTGESVKNIPKDSNEDKEYYASYQPIEYRIIYHWNNGVQADNPVTTYTIETETFSLPELTGRDGYTFAGWSEKNESIDDLYLQIEKGTIGNKEFSDRWFTTVTNFDYTGEEQEFKVLRSGTYKLEVWGAQGGKTQYTGNGGLGGYSSGNAIISNKSILYVNVGNQPNSYNIGSYNGGNNGYLSMGGSNIHIQIGSGGGATHIATSSGELKLLENKKSSVLIVAGGGGGGGRYANYGTIPGGNGGGLTSGYMYRATTSTTNYQQSKNYGARYDGIYVQNDVGIFCTSADPNPYPINMSKGTFGQGSTAGGGGYYGGAHYGSCNIVYAGGGGSGYIGGVTSGTSTSGVKTGNGYARITWVGDN